ncbi:pyridoxal phosphate-dependent aminotransferase [Pseudahrensia aquimaris]|uniref:aspartate transaminase n=1 Tax=Pseudahrensia aquimaris TaxID=744461 RepID=A0ABW3FJ03_9HYPH
MSNLSTASITDRLSSLGAERWQVHFDARARAQAGEDIIELTIGEPDVPVSAHLIAKAHEAMLAGRTRYSGGRGEKVACEAIAAKYAKRTRRDITAANVLTLPGTQAALSFAMLALVEAGDDVLVPDPYYATYEGTVRATGANFVPVPMSAENGFRLTPEQVEAAITPNTKVLLLNFPHNPTGAVLTAEEIAAIGAVCAKHNLWIVSDEVYEQLVYGVPFASAFDNPDLAERTIAVSSISKSHAAPGFRSGWCVGPAWFTDAMQGVSESFLFGGQPFIADMTVEALTKPDDTAARMCEKYQRRIGVLLDGLSGSNRVKPLVPKSGMFMLVDVAATGVSGAEFCRRLLDEKAVATMPGSSFGAQAHDYIRLSLTVEDEKLVQAAKRIVELAEEI